MTSFRPLTREVAESLKPGTIYVVCNERRDYSDELTGTPETEAPWFVVIESPVRPGDDRLSIEFGESGQGRGAAWDTAELYEFECPEDGQAKCFCSGSGADPVWILA